MTDKIQGLPTIHFLQYPELYNERDIKPLTRQANLTGAERREMERALFQIESIVDNSITTDGGSKLGEHLRPMQNIVLQLNSILRGREVSGHVLVRRSQGWIQRKVETKQPEGASTCSNR